MMPRITSPSTRFTAAEFERMADAGLFDGRRVELINGRIYRMAPQNDPHMMAISNVTRTLVAAVPASEWLVVQGTLRLDANTMVDPDFMWFPCPVGTPQGQRRLPMLLVEVSDSTYRTDAGIKLRKYAKAGVRDYWIVNVREGRLEIHREPHNPTGRLAGCGYGAVGHHRRGEQVSPLERPGVVLNVEDLLP